MEIISADVLDRIRDRCTTMNYYRACIFCNSRERARDIQETLLNAWSAMGRGHRLSSLDVLFLSTNSLVRILTYGEVLSGSARGNKFHEICIDVDNVHMTVQIRDALNRMIIPYLHNGRQVTADSDEQYFEHIDTRYSFDPFDISTGSGPRVRVTCEPYEPVLIKEDIVDSLRKWRDELRVDRSHMWSVENRRAPDFGDFEPSSEILEYIGGACG